MVTISTRSLLCIVRSFILDDIGDDSGFAVIVRVLRKEVLDIAMAHNDILVKVLDFAVRILVRHDLLMVFKELDEGLVAQVVSIESECIHTNFHKTGQELLHFRKDMLCCKCLLQVNCIVEYREVFNIYTAFPEIFSHFVDSLAQKGCILVQCIDIGDVVGNVQLIVFAVVSQEPDGHRKADATLKICQIESNGVNDIRNSTVLRILDGSRAAMNTEKVIAVLVDAHVLILEDDQIIQRQRHRNLRFQEFEKIIYVLVNPSVVVHGFDAFLRLHDILTRKRLVTACLTKLVFRHGIRCLGDFLQGNLGRLRLCFAVRKTVHIYAAEMRCLGKLLLCPRTDGFLDERRQLIGVISRILLIIILGTVILVQPAVKNRITDIMQGNICPDCKQEFKASICNVVKSLMYYHTGCPVCAGRKVVPGINDLATQCPKVVPLWSDKNDYTPSEISARSERRAIFVCPDCKKEFVTSVRAMTRAIASGATCCPDCKMRMRTISAACKDEHDYAKSVGTTMTMKNGSKATCIAYHGVNNITVKFEDGFVLYHARWNQFVRGALHHNQKNINE